MLSGEIVSGIPEWRTEVTVNGVVRAVQAVSWDTEIVGDLPDQVIATGGLSGTSGTITWAQQQPVGTWPVSPWAKVAGWPPTAGDRVRVRVTDGVTWWTRWSGVIDNTTGVPGGGYQSKIIDDRDQLKGTFTYEAILRHGVPYVEDGDYRSVGLNFWYPLTQALRSRGFCNTPPIEARTEFSAPLQGSVWPESGFLMDAGGSASQPHASFQYAPWGYAAGGFTAAFAPRIGDSPVTPIQFTMMLAPDHAGVAYVDARFTDVRIRLRASSVRGVEAIHIVGTVETVVASLSPGVIADASTVTLLVKLGAWTLRADNGAEATGARDVVAGTMTSMSISAQDDARIAGVQISRPNSTVREFVSLDFEPRMRFISSGLASTMDMMPALKGRSVPDLVDEILAATLTGSWWDEEGRLVLQPSNVLYDGPLSQTVTTRDDITALSWEDSLLAVRSAVEVKWKSPSVSKGRQYRLELWRGPEESIVAGDDPLEQFVEPPSGTEWFGVDRTVVKLDDSNWGAFSRRGSYGGLRFEDGNGDEVPTSSASTQVTARSMYADSLVVTTAVSGLPSHLEGITATSTKAAALWEHLRGKPLPLVRGMGRGEWVDEVYQTSAGPSTAPVLEHDLGYWGQEYFDGDSVAQRIGNWLAGMVSAPHPTITNLGLTYDPRRQLGDVYMLRSEWLGIELRVLVVGISESHGTGSHQSLKVRVIRATNIRGVTYDDLAAAWDPSNYAGLQAAWAALNYDAFVANPLEGAPS